MTRQAVVRLLILVLPRIMFADRGHGVLSCSSGVLGYNVQPIFRALCVSEERASKGMLVLVLRSLIHPRERCPSTLRPHPSV